jgi:hypothetical protein
VQGLLFVTAVLILYSCRGLYLTLNLLDQLKIARYREVFADFVSWIGGYSGENAIAQIWRSGELHFERMANATWNGSVVDRVLNTARDDCDRLIQRFAADQTHWYEGAYAEYADLLRAAVEFDLLNRPYPYVQTKFGMDVELQHVHIDGRQRGLWQATLPFDFPNMIEKLRNEGTFEAQDLQPRPVTVTINHRHGLVFYSAKWTDDERYRSTYHTIRELRNIEARYESLVPIQARSA